MINPATMMKLLQAKNKFTESHPKFVAFLSAVYARGICEGTVIEIKVTRPDEQPMTANIKVNQSDLELFEELKNLKN